MRLLNRLWAWVAYGLRVTKPHIFPLIFSHLISHILATLLCGFSHFSKQFYRHFTIIKSALKQKKKIALRSEEKKNVNENSMIFLLHSMTPYIFLINVCVLLHFLSFSCTFFGPIRNCLSHYNLMCNGN